MVIQDTSAMTVYDAGLVSQPTTEIVMRSFARTIAALALVTGLGAAVAAGSSTSRTRTGENHDHRIGTENHRHRRRHRRLAENWRAPASCTTPAGSM